jgi:ketosteroid isomerase-like protein
MSSEEQIEHLIRQQEAAVQRKDMDGAMVNYAKDVVSFDVVDTLQKVGVAACRQRLENWLSQFPGSFSYKIEQLSITANEDLGFCNSFNHVKGRLENGDEIDMRWRATICFKRENDKWFIIHEHSSVPFDPKTGKALIKLDE